MAPAPFSQKKSDGGFYRVIFKVRKILPYSEVCEFFEPEENGSRKPPDDFLLEKQIKTCYTILNIGERK